METPLSRPAALLSTRCRGDKSSSLPSSAACFPLFPSFKSLLLSLFRRRWGCYDHRKTTRRKDWKTRLVSLDLQNNWGYQCEDANVCECKAQRHKWSFLLFLWFPGTKKPLREKIMRSTVLYPGNLSRLKVSVKCTDSPSFWQQGEKIGTTLKCVKYRAGAVRGLA